MTTRSNIKYPIGDQSFESVRNGKFLYVDKTQYIEKIVSADKYFFLGRPRRFGKSLFLSSLECFFKGQRNLFKGLYIDSVDWSWEPYPVLMLDLNTERYERRELLGNVLLNHILKWEEEYEVVPKVDDLSSRFGNVIEAAFAKSNREVVVLVDEYDKPLVNNLHNPEVFDANRNLLSSVYANFKSKAKYLRLVFLTGVSRFSKLNLFSDLNNIRNISLSDDFANICGITTQELLDYFQYGIHEIAEYEGITDEKVVAELKKRYDGYHFSRRGADIYNPYSLLNAMANKTMSNYWIDSGTPSLLVEQLQKQDLDIEQVVDSEATDSDLSGLDLQDPDAVALFYQTGYITIKGYDPSTEMFTLGFPNEEVKRGLLSYILPHYANLGKMKTARFILNFERELNNGEVDAFMTRLQTMFAGTLYDLHTENENNVQCILFSFINLLGLDIQAEWRTSRGRIDLFFGTKKYLYIIELKYNGSAREAINQINSHDYAMPFRQDAREIIKVGVNFSSKKRNIVDWVKEP